MSSRADELFELEAVGLVLSRKERAKGGLVPFSEQLLRELERHQSEFEPNESLRDLATLFNNAAMIQFQAGQVERASDLCHQAITFYLTAQQISPRWLASIVQPYINLGRIRAARGECAASIEIYASLVRLLEDQEPVVIDGFVIGRSELAQILDTEPSIQNVIINVYVSDSIKAFLISKDYEGLIAFLDEIEGSSWLDDSSYRYSLAREARARAWLGIGEYNKALKILDELSRKLNRQGTAQLVIYALIADIYRRGRRPDQVKRVLGFVEKKIQTVVSAGIDRFAAANLVYLLGLGLYSVQEYDSAYRSAAKAHQLATDLGDEVARLKCLMLLFGISSEAQLQGGVAGRTLWFSELHTLAHHTSYQFERAVALFWLNSGTSVGRQGDLQQNEESILSGLEESLACFRSLNLAGCGRWQVKVIERMRQLSPSHAVEQFSPELPESIDALYTALKQFDGWLIGNHHAKLAPALSAGV